MCLLDKEDCTGKRETANESLHAKLRERMSPDDSASDTIAGSFRRVSPNGHFMSQHGSRNTAACLRSPSIHRSRITTYKINRVHTRAHALISLAVLCKNRKWLRNPPLLPPQFLSSPTDRLAIFLASPGLPASAIPRNASRTFLAEGDRKQGDGVYGKSSWNTVERDGRYEEGAVVDEGSTATSIRRPLKPVHRHLVTARLANRVILVLRLTNDKDRIAAFRKLAITQSRSDP